MAEYLLQHFLARAAANAPDHIAVACAGKTLDYASLERRSDEIAALLQAHGARRGDLVGVALPKSVETIACWFGALKAGCAYVPIDASSPAPRVRAILEQGRIRVLIAEARRKELAEAPPPTLARVLWDRRPATGEASLEDAQGKPRPERGLDLDLAYVYFTSGSTGRPKGVLITHRASISYLAIGDELLKPRPEDVVANHAPLAFDLASFDVHLAVRAGCKVALIPEMATLMPGSMLSFFEAEKPTLMYTVPTTLNRLAALSSIEAQRFPSLRGLLFAGEAPNVGALKVLRPVFPNATFHHWYGSTEAALVTQVPFAPGEELPDPLPIGEAVDNVALAIADEDGRPRPLAEGSTGELLVSATLLLEGYAHEAQLTAEAFVVEPGLVPTRWFRTKDVVRVDGSRLYYVGRNDRMVKVKGLRVDLGEIESTLQHHDGVQECAVVTVPDASTGAKIYAFVVGAGLDAAQARAYLRAHVSAHMVPEQVQVVTTLPRTASGKIDRLALAKTLS